MVAGFFVLKAIPKRRDWYLQNEVLMLQKIAPLGDSEGTLLVFESS